MQETGVEREEDCREKNVVRNHESSRRKVVAKSCTHLSFPDREHVGRHVGDSLLEGDDGVLGKGRIDDFKSSRRESSLRVERRGAKGLQRRMLVSCYLVDDEGVALRECTLSKKANENGFARKKTGRTRPLSCPQSLTCFPSTINEPKASASAVAKSTPFPLSIEASRFET